MYIDFEEIGKIAADDIGIFTPPGGSGDFVPIRVLEPVKENPILPADDGGGGMVKFRAFNYSGRVQDSVTGEPISGASVSLINGGQIIQRVFANNKGEFSVSMEGPAEIIEVTAAEYTGWDFPASEQQHVFELERKVKDLPPVLLPGGGSNSWLWLALLGGVAIYDQSQKKKVGAVDKNTVLVVGLGAALFMGFGVIKNILEGLGIFQSQDGKDYEDHLSDPGSFWSPEMWKKGPAGTLIITEAGCQHLFSEIYNSFSPFGDDEARIYAAFKTLKTQSQLSYFAWWVREKHGVDLLRWLHGGNVGPIGDNLSVAEIAVITDYFNKLPRWKV